MNDSKDINIKDIIRRHIVQPKLDEKFGAATKALELTIGDDTNNSVKKCEKFIQNYLDHHTNFFIKQQQDAIKEQYSNFIKKQMEEGKDVQKT